MLGFLFFLAILFFVLVPLLLGGIPFGYLLAKTKHKNIKELGSKNIGATNVLRNTNKSLGILTLLLDFLKGYFAVIFSVCIFHLLVVYNAHFFAHLFAIAYISCFFVVLGHCFSVYLKFVGGKGISTSGGVILAVSPSLFLVVTIAIIVIFAIYKIVSLSALITAGVAGTFCFIPWLNYYYLQLINTNTSSYFASIEALSTNTYFHVLATSIILLCMVILVIVRHQKNIDRLLVKRERIFQVGGDSINQQNYKEFKHEKK